jgi:hypothetical protein
VIDLSAMRCGSLAADAATARVPHSLHGSGENPDDELHEHAIEPPDEVPLEPLSPHPGSDPVEASTEPRSEHPERRPPRTRGTAPASRMHPSR